MMAKGLTMEELIRMGATPVEPKHFMQALTLEELKALGAEPIKPPKPEAPKIEKVIEKTVEKVVEKVDNEKVKELEQKLVVKEKENEQTLKVLQAEIASLRKKVENQENYNVSAGVSPLMVLAANALVSGQTQRINFNGATVALRNDGGVDVTFSGGGFTILTATGAKDDSNVTYTFTQAPSAIVQNGQMLRDGAGYTLSGLTATMSNPTGTGGDIYGIV